MGRPTTERGKPERGQLAYFLFGIGCTLPRLFLGWPRHWLRHYRPRHHFTTAACMYCSRSSTMRVSRQGHSTTLLQIPVQGVHPSASVRMYFYSTNEDVDRFMEVPEEAHELVQVRVSVLRGAHLIIGAVCTYSENLFACLNYVDLKITRLFTVNANANWCWNLLYFSCHCLVPDGRDERDERDGMRRLQCLFPEYFLNLHKYIHTYLDKHHTPWHWGQPQ